ncbi:hypothetical protein FLK61_41355 [Paenalkalicoccus suaedae]|uniref:Uncharacterized protein n=1 Tax=Paenalkalicoccus suaedae TaxID=2592382 RepID=A0A859FJR0_9BACI|nr:hypothetical protein [Paenalkalicoccus suaedae]QKS73041.1 hypothetical protein FLK61_41355 [Paenalkalicoccus suaedae]
MSKKWKSALLIGIILGSVSLILSYGFPDLSDPLRLAILVVAAALAAGFIYKLFYGKVNPSRNKT